MKRALVSLLAILTAAGCAEATGPDDLLEELGIPRMEAPDIPVGQPVSLVFGAGEEPEPRQKLEVEMTPVGDHIVVQTRYSTGGCGLIMDATADRAGNQLVLRVRTSPNPTALCLAVAGPFPVSYGAALTQLEPGTYRVRLVHDDTWLQHRYLAADETVVLD